MTIPQGSYYPTTIDTDDNLFLVHDSLRLRLTGDYEPGDTQIKGEGAANIVNIIPPTGLITLTEQCSDIDKRAISFYYGVFDAATVTFSELELLSGFEDVVKQKRITDITVNVIAPHHNNLKDALINIQEFIGRKGTIDSEPFGPTLEGRINFLRRLVMQPKAWFTADKRIGNVPLEIEFTDMSFRLGTDGNAGVVTLTWDFGDQTTSVVSLISATDSVPDDAINVIVWDKDGGSIKKTYHQPGLYDVKLTVQNGFGSDTIVFPEFVNARVKAPDEAIMQFVADTGTQDTTPGVPADGPFQIFPRIRSPINTLIEIEIPPGENPANPGYTYAGELLGITGNIIDPITSYTWSLGDDLIHPNSTVTKASFGVGGIYDLKLRADTQCGAYRITTYEDSIDIIENQNLWLFLFDDSDSVRAYEYGLISETFKLSPSSSYTIARDDSFLETAANAIQQTREFNRNTGFCSRTNLMSGAKGTMMLYWASGRSSSALASSEEIRIVEYGGFTNSYVSHSPIQRQWNWANFNNNGYSYFVFGAMPSYMPNTSFTNTTRQRLDLTTFTTSSSVLTADNYLNGANELEQNVARYDASGESIFGNFSVYRTAWSGDTGYMLRNDGVGPFFRIRDFYRTEGLVGDYFQNIRKLQDLQGPTKTEGGLANLSNGVYFLNNSGSVSRFSPNDGVWQIGGPGVNSQMYRSLQDTTVTNYDNSNNTLLVGSDGDSRAYLSFDYSPNTFLLFNVIDLTFLSLGSRPEGDQFAMEVY